MAHSVCRRTVRCYGGERAMSHERRVHARISCTHSCKSYHLAISNSTEPIFRLKKSPQCLYSKWPKRMITIAVNQAIGVWSRKRWNFQIAHEARVIFKGKMENGGMVVDDGDGRDRDRENTSGGHVRARNPWRATNSKSSAVAARGSVGTDAVKPSQNKTRANCVPRVGGTRRTWLPVPAFSAAAAAAATARCTRALPPPSIQHRNRAPTPNPSAEPTVY